MELRRAAAGLQDAEDDYVSGEDADADRGNHGDAENQRHEERNHNQPPLSVAVIRCRRRNFRLCGFFNLPAPSRAASDDPDAP